MGMPAPQILGVAKAPFEARGENTIAVQTGHRLRVVEEHSTQWTFVINEDTGDSGWVPDWAVSRPGRLMRALSDFEAHSENELSIFRGEVLNVVERHETGWTFGKKHEKDLEGWFPDWVVSSPKNRYN